MSTQIFSDETRDLYSQKAEFTVLRWLLIAVVREHPQKEAVLASFQHMMANLPKKVRDNMLPAFVQSNEVVAQAVERSPEVAAQLADEFAYLAEQFQKYAQDLLQDCQ